jgi:predicted nucleotidyltransferase component of viral defense system
MRELTRLFSYTKAELAAKAEELNFVRDTLEKAIRLSQILSYLHSNPLTKTTLALKGGTAINFMVFDLPRLSVDIDLDYSRPDTREEMIRTYMATQGYTLSPRSRSRHSLDSLVFTYVNLGGMQDNIKIEINYSLRAHIFDPADRQVITKALGHSQQIYCLLPLEIFAAKINALLSRTAARDLYDVWNMIRFDLFDESEQKLLRKSVVFYAAVSQEEVPEAYNFERIETVNNRKIKTELLPCIRRGEFVELAKMKQTVKNYLVELLTLTEKEKEFLAAFRRREYKPELLFDDNQIIENIREHPMILWKMQH